MDFGKLIEKLRIESLLGLLIKVKDAVLALASEIITFPKSLPERLQDTFNEAQADLGRTRRIIVFVLAGVAVVMIFSIIITIVINTIRPEPEEALHVVIGVSIPSEDLFFPSEPDFVPDFLPEREPRRFWSLDEIRRYWKIPENSDWWRGEIKSTVDRLMEGVP